MTVINVWIIIRAGADFSKIKSAPISYCLIYRYIGRITYETVQKLSDCVDGNTISDTELLFDKANGERNNPFCNKADIV